MSVQVLSKVDSSSHEWIEIKVPNRDQYEFFCCIKCNSCMQKDKLTGLEVIELDRSDNTLSCSVTVTTDVLDFCVVRDRSGLNRALLSNISIHEELVGRDDLSYLEACKLADKLNSIRDVLDD